MIASIVYPALANHAPLSALVATRIYRDYAGDVPVAPYAVWSILASVPSGHISGKPRADRYSVSVDVFGNAPQQADDLVIAARNAMEGIGELSSGPQSLGRDELTKLWRYTLTIDVFRPR